MIRPIVIVAILALNAAPAAEAPQGLQGDGDAISDAIAMVEAMGGVAIWKDLASVHFVHEWDVVNRVDRYVEHEILDLTGPRSFVTMDSEIRSRTRAYSPEHRYWTVDNGAFEFGDGDALERAMERAPYSLYRLARTIARGETGIEIRYGAIDGIGGPPALEFAGSDGEPRGWILLNARKEPMIWATTQYVYVLGPLRRFGNLRVPDWATTSNGLVRYVMVSLSGSTTRPDLSLFAPPAEYVDGE